MSTRRDISSRVSKTVAHQTTQPIPVLGTAAASDTYVTPTQCPLLPWLVSQIQDQVDNNPTNQVSNLILSEMRLTLRQLRTLRSERKLQDVSRKVLHFLTKGDNCHSILSSFSLIHTCTHTFSLFLSHTHTHSHTCTHTRMHTRTQTHRHMHRHTHILTHTHRHTHILTHTHTHIGT